jgi:hypothetical protein
MARAGRSAQFRIFGRSRNKETGPDREITRQAAGFAGAPAEYTPLEPHYRIDINTVPPRIDTAATDMNIIAPRQATPVPIGRIAHAG